MGWQLPRPKKQSDYRNPLLSVSRKYPYLSAISQGVVFDGFGQYRPRSAFSTAAGTKELTSPPNFATSLIELDERKINFSFGTRNTTSICLCKIRLIRAIWNSYSKSETARSPRKMRSALISRA